MSGLPPGIYENLITEALAARLLQIDERLQAETEELRTAEAPDRLALHLGRIIQRAVSSFTDSERLSRGLELARSIIDLLEASFGADSSDEAVCAPPRILQGIAERQPDGSFGSIQRPLLPLLDTTLLTNARGEPRVGHQIHAEVQSADRIDLVMAFVRRSGLASLLPALKRHREMGKPLRVLTTTYTGTTQASALEDLVRIGVQVRVSYDTSSTRLHAKAWIFHRNSGFSTAYVGSSNLTHSAQVNGLEWNIRVSGARNPDVLQKITAVFESYWASDDFRPYERGEFERHTKSEPAGAPIKLSPLELRLEPFQEHLLERIELARCRGHHRNLLVSATGTGKTVMAASDYAGLREKLPRSRLLYVAHREELLRQSRATYAQALRDAGFGELWVGGSRPTRFDHVFASIQSLGGARLSDLRPDHFDVVVIDEFHHAAAPTYRALLEHLRPVELLGLTATPERSDGLPILQWFDGRIAAELRLWDAIEQHRLCPFLYYGIHDGLDLREIPWQRGRGYDVERLTALMTSDGRWARGVLSKVGVYVDDPRKVRALGFCVSVDHARFMARTFTEEGIPAEAIWADTPLQDRRAALQKLARRDVNVLFTVDLFNEGVDVPAVDTLLMLRPTDSPVLFIQQLGRGLRRSPGKSACTVLDFVGHHRTEFRYDRRLRALLGGTRGAIVRQVEAGFPFLPAGCHFELDPVASSIVLRNLREALPSRWTAKVEELRTVAAESGDLSLGKFLEESGLEIEDIFERGRSWSELRADAGLAAAPGGLHDAVLGRACGRLLHVDDEDRIKAWRSSLESPVPPDPARLAPRERRLLHMLIATLCDQLLGKQSTLEEGCRLVWAHPRCRYDLLAILDVLRGRIQHFQHRLTTHPEVPLMVHSRYTRIEILAAFGVGKGATVPPWQTGVHWLADARADLLAFTLDKTRGQFSPTTRYRDYAIDRRRIHWESQSTTRADSETGRRYRNHVELGTSILLFAREHVGQRAFWFLGPAHYLSHESEQPMAMAWQLLHPLPGDLFATFAAAVA